MILLVVDTQKGCFNEKLFAFELLGFDPNVHTVDEVREIIKGSFMDGNDQYDLDQFTFFHSC